MKTKDKNKKRVTHITRFEDKAYINIAFEGAENKREEIIRFYLSTINVNFKTLPESAATLLVDYMIKYANEVGYPEYHIPFDENLQDLQRLLEENHFLIYNDDGTFRLAHSLSKRIKYINLSWI